MEIRLNEEELNLLNMGDVYYTDNNTKYMNYPFWIKQKNGLTSLVDFKEVPLEALENQYYRLSNAIGLIKMEKAKKELEEKKEKEMLYNSEKFIIDKDSKIVDL